MLGEHQNMFRRVTEVRNIPPAPERVVIRRSPARNLDTTPTGLSWNPITRIRPKFL